jgi:hypothetical protein
MGYGFNLQFTPAWSHAFLEWRAYATADIPDEKWKDVPYTYFTDNNIQQITKVDVPKLGESGGTGKITVNIKEPVTLIPFSRGQPRIINAVPNALITPGIPPGMDPNNPTRQILHGRSRNILISFAGPLTPSTVERFGIGFIRIERRSVNEDGTVNNDPMPITSEIYFRQPQYEISNHTIRIAPTAGPPANSQVTLSLGTSITTTQNDSWQNPVELVWFTARNDFFVGTWKAWYDENTR